MRDSQGTRPPAADRGKLAKVQVPYATYVWGTESCQNAVSTVISVIYCMVTLYTFTTAPFTVSLCFFILE